MKINIKSLDYCKYNNLYFCTMSLLGNGKGRWGNQRGKCFCNFWWRRQVKNITVSDWLNSTNGFDNYDGVLDSYLSELKMILVKK